MKSLRILLLALVIIVIFSGSILAADTQLTVNGNTMKISPALSNGVSQLPLETALEVLGADLSWDGDSTFTIQENGETLQMTLGQTTALFNGKTVESPLAPQKAGNSVLLPLRFVLGIFGADAVWNPSGKKIEVSYKELRDNLSATDMLLKSSEASRQFNTYRMQGSSETDIDSLLNGELQTENVPQKVIQSLEGIIQADPMKLYMKQSIDLPDLPAEEKAKLPQGMPLIETYMTEDTLYMKVPELGWTKQPMPLPADLLKEQKDISSDPLAAAQQMQDFGLLLNFGNDISDGQKDFYVINCRLDMDKFRQSFDKIIAQAAQSLSASGSQTMAEDQKAALQALKNMKLDYRYQTYINKNTLLIEKIAIAIDMTMATTKVDNGKTENLLMQMKTTGSFLITDYGIDFTEPDVSQAKEMPLQ